MQLRGRKQNLVRLFEQMQQYQFESQLAADADQPLESHVRALTDDDVDGSVSLCLCVFVSRVVCLHLSFPLSLCFSLCVCLLCCLSLSLSLYVCLLCCLSPSVFPSVSLQTLLLSFCFVYKAWVLLTGTELPYCADVLLRSCSLNVYVKSDCYAVAPPIISHNYTNMIFHETCQTEQTG